MYIEGCFLHKVHFEKYVFGSLMFPQWGTLPIVQEWIKAAGLESRPLKVLFLPAQQQFTVLHKSCGPRVAILSQHSLYFSSSFLSLWLMRANPKFGKRFCIIIIKFTLTLINKGPPESPEQLSFLFPDAQIWLSCKSMSIFFHILLHSSWNSMLRSTYWRDVDSILFSVFPHPATAQKKGGGSN